MSILNTHNLVATVVNPLKISWGSEIKSEFQFIIGCIQLYQMFDWSKFFQGLQVIPWNVYILQVFILLNSINGSQVAVRDWQW